MNTFDFDLWVSLERSDSKAFEILRRKVMDKEIRKNAKNSIELWKKRGWWTRVELDLHVHKSAVGRMVAASRKMNLKLIELNDNWSNLHDTLS